MGNELTVAGWKKPVKVLGNVSIRYCKFGENIDNKYDVKCYNNKVDVYDRHGSPTKALCLNSYEANKLFKNVIGDDNTLSIKDLKNLNNATKSIFTKIDTDYSESEARAVFRLKEGESLIIDFETSEEHNKAED